MACLITEAVSYAADKAAGREHKPFECLKKDDWAPTEGSLDDFLERELKARRERVGGTAVAVKEGKEEEKKEEDGGKTKEEGKKKRKWFFFGGSKGKVENAVDLA